MRRSTVLILGAAAVIAASPAFAGKPDKRVNFTVGGGWTFPLSAAGDRLNTGFNTSFGVTFNITDFFGIQFEPEFNKMNAKASAIVGVTSLGANMQVWQFPINLVFQTSPKKKVGAYILLGGGAFQVKGSITAATTTGGTVCDPFWGVCYPVGVTDTQVLGSRSATKGGFGIGGGITFKMGEKARFFIETRYNYVNLKNLGESTANYSYDVNLQYMPLTLGFRF